MSGDEQVQPMARPGPAAFAGIQERGQVLGTDLWQIPRQDSARKCTRWTWSGPESSRLTPAYLLASVGVNV
jgi:hypothetical protein